jgi:hypothetical protein
MAMLLIPPAEPREWVPHPSRFSKGGQQSDRTMGACIFWRRPEQVFTGADRYDLRIVGSRTSSRRIGVGRSARTSSSHRQVLLLIATQRSLTHSFALILLTMNEVCFLYANKKTINRSTAISMDSRFLSQGRCDSILAYIFKSRINVKREQIVR